jgi:hypothetical protein
MSVETCEPCQATSECMGIDVCAPMQFDGTDRDNYYCLPLDAGECTAPYPVAKSVMTIGDAMADVCTLNEMLTTCEALLDYQAPCADASECGADGLDDGLCEPIEFDVAACTIPCSGVGSMECPSDIFGCATGNVGEMWCGAY